MRKWDRNVHLSPSKMDHFRGSTVYGFKFCGPNSGAEMQLPVLVFLIVKSVKHYFDFEGHILVFLKQLLGNMAETTFFLPCLLLFPEKTRSCLPIGKKYAVN